MLIENAMAYFGSKTWDQNGFKWDQNRGYFYPNDADA
jgi:hypothetical protein